MMGAGEDNAYSATTIMYDETEGIYKAYAVGGVQTESYDIATAMAAETATEGSDVRDTFNGTTAYAGYSISGTSLAPLRVRVTLSRLGLGTSFYLWVDPFMPQNGDLLSKFIASDPFLTAAACAQSASNETLLSTGLTTEFGITMPVVLQDLIIAHSSLSCANFVSDIMCSPGSVMLHEINGPLCALLAPPPIVDDDTTDTTDSTGDKLSSTAITIISITSAVALIVIIALVAGAMSRKKRSPYAS
jgi:hypothetical protein